jgi:hypothetical protein
VRIHSEKGFSGMKDNPQYSGENQERGHLSLTREQLYELVWSKPMQHLAKDYGVSDRAMAKLCARNQVPVPPRGYWAKKNSGYKVVQPPLPAFVTKEKPKPESPESKVQKPVKKKTSLSNTWEDQEKNIKQIFRDFRRRLSNGIRYTISIDSWSCDYSFGINSNFDPLRHYGDIRDSLHDKPFKEYRWVVFKGKFLDPPQLKDQEVKVNLAPDIHLNEAVRDKYLHLYREDPPKSLGSLQKGKASTWCYISFPEEAMNTILEAVLANKINIITFYGEKTRYGRASIFNFSLQEKAEDDE